MLKITGADSVMAIDRRLQCHLQSMAIHFPV
jgi:hypothetical protein